MAQIAQKRMYFSIGGTSSAENDDGDIYVDIPACLTTINRKQYHQVTAKGDPLCYTVTVTALKTSKPLEICTAPNTWTTRNAVKKTAEGWKEQMKNSNIKMSQLPTYARRFRCALDAGAITNAVGQELNAQLVPDDCGGKRLFTPYDAPDGTTIDFFNSNEVVFLAIGEGATADYKPMLCDATASDDFGMIYEYLKSRRNMREESDTTTEFPDSDGLMNTLFATSEELADDVTAAVTEYNTARPYSEHNAQKLVKQAYVAANSTNYTETFSAPLGLLVFSADGVSEEDEFFITVEAVYEM